MDEAQVDAEKLRQVSKLQRSIELPTRDDIDLYSRECVCDCVCECVCVRVCRVQINHASDCSITIELHVPLALLPHALGEPQIEPISFKLFR